MKITLKCFYADFNPGQTVEIEDVQAQAMLDMGSAELPVADEAATEPAPAPKGKGK